MKFLIGVIVGAVLLYVTAGFIFYRDWARTL